MVAPFLASVWLSVGEVNIDLSSKSIQEALEELSNFDFIAYPIRNRTRIEKHISKLLNTDKANDVIALVEVDGNLVSTVQFRLCSRDLGLFYSSLFDHDAGAIIHIAGFWTD